MVYTKQELINAFCERMGIQEADLPAVEAQLQANINNQKTNIQARIDNMPSAKQRMKLIALRYLARKSSLQSIADNEHVNL